jgi:hypothetical protein
VAQNRPVHFHDSFMIAENPIPVTLPVSFDHQVSAKNLAPGFAAHP